MKDPVRVAAGKINALKLHGLHDSKRLTANARSAFLQKFRDQAAAAAAARGEEITEEELERRAGYLVKHYFALMAHEREKARKKRKTAGAMTSPAVQEVGRVSGATS